MSFQNARIIAKDVASEDYIADPHPRGSREYVMSSSALRLFGQCASRWRHGYVSPETSAKNIGNLFDCLLLTPHLFEKRYAIHPDTFKDTVMECPKCLSQTQSNKCAKCKCDRVMVEIEKSWNWNNSKCEAWKQERPSQEFISIEENNGAKLARDRMLADPILAPFLAASDRQVWVAGEWHDEATGLSVPVKALLDLVPRKDTEFYGSLGDLKSCRNAAVFPWQSDCRRFAYPIQSAFHLDLFNAATGEARDTWCFLLLENYPPYEPGRRMLSLDYLSLARNEVKRLMGNYCACLAADKWPGYDDGPETTQGWSLIEPSDNDKAYSMVAPRFDFSEPEDDEPEDHSEEVGNVP